MSGAAHMGFATPCPGIPNNNLIAFPAFNKRHYGISAPYSQDSAGCFANAASRRRDNHTGVATEVAPHLFDQ